MEYTFIVNPKARTGKGELIWRQIEPELKKRRVKYEVFFTEYKRQATELVAKITSDEWEHTIVVLGGDGSINEVISGIRDCSKVTLGYIPAGSGNDFTRVLNIPTDVKEALETVLSAEKRIPMDVGKMKCQGKKYRFAVSTGIGFDAAVCHEVAKSRMKVILNHLKLGQLSYLGMALRCLFKGKTVKATVTMDGKEPKVFEKTLFTAVMNHPYEGGGFCFCPKAKTDDGYLDVIVVSGISKLKILCLLPLAFKGKHVGHKGIDIFQCQKVKIELEEKYPVHTDGEPIAVEDEMEVELLKNQIHILVPNKE